MSRRFDKKHNIVITFLILIYTVGLAGILYTPTRDLFNTLTPISLLISATLLFSTHQNKTKQFFIFLALSFSLGILIEWVGVQTGWPFGAYWYGSTLGPQIDGVPWMIGVNWSLVTYAVGSGLEGIFSQKIVKIFLGAAVMVGLDFLIEPVAIALDYWHWENEKIPIQNYIGWCVVSLVQLWMYYGLSFNRKNKISQLFLTILIVFFGGLCLYFKYLSQ